MNTIRQTVRPKHQMLILKCYPRFQKNAVEVKPNSSELSYLLYYASTRRSKLQKVAAFLEKKTVSDVWRVRNGNVQVTLQILKALIEKCPRDLPLYSLSILNILDTVLKSNDVTLVEESVATFEAFCSHQDSTTLAADVEHTRQFQEIVRAYTRFASKTTQVPNKTHISFPVALRFRTAGLHAIKGLVSSAYFATDATSLCHDFIPTVLENITSDRPGYLSLLQHRESSKEKSEKDITHKRRPSFTAPPSTIDAKDGDAAAAVSTTADVDQKAEEEVGVLALSCLRQAYSGDNRGVIRISTNAVLDFCMAYAIEAPEYRNRRIFVAQLFELACKWVAVQDRFVILVTVMEVLIKRPIKESDMHNHLLLVEIVESLLCSSVNLIGLSIMDVLLGLVQHVLLVLQLGGAGTKIAPHLQQTLEVVTSKPQSRRASPSGQPNASSVEIEIASAPTALRVQLLNRIQSCMSNLATHVYYADQISDMVSAVLMRLKPSPSPAMPSAASAITDPTAAADAVADSASLNENPHTDGFFSFETARLLALNAVKDIIVVANSRRRDGDHSSGRNPVDISAWNGTQWLLRDPEPKIRKAYIEALLTWLELETAKQNVRVTDKPLRSSRAAPTEPGAATSISRRAISNASQKNTYNAQERWSFLSLLNLAIYENATQYAESEADILLLHLLLTRLTYKLGVNSVRTTLPMIFQLQEEVMNVETPEAKICIGSLVHGYFWALAEFFDFDTSAVGKTIFDEINRRTKVGAWVTKVKLPPVPLQDIAFDESGELSKPKLDAEVAASAVLKPFDDRTDLVSCIADSYGNVLFSPPSSPPVSPGRPLSSASLSRFNSSKMDFELPSHVKNELMVEWSKDACMAAAEREATRSNSLTGSRLGSTRDARAGAAAGGAQSSDDAGSQGRNGAAPMTPPDENARSRRLSYVGSVLTSRGNDVMAQPIIRVSQLKDILAGERSPYRPITSHRHDDGDDTASESMVSIGPSVSNYSVAFTDGASVRNQGQTVSSPEVSGDVAGNRKSTDRKAAGSRAQHADDDVPPVPSLPAMSLSLDFGNPTSGLRDSSMTSSQDFARDASSTRLASGKADLRLLLSGVQSLPKSKALTTLGSPPY